MLMLTCMELLVTKNNLACPWDPTGRSTDNTQNDSWMYTANTRCSRMNRCRKVDACSVEEP